MLVNINYQNELNKIIDKIICEKRNPSLLLHSCCAPCSSYVLEYLYNYFHITVFYYNPNIYPYEEYTKRVNEQKQFILNFDDNNKINFIEGSYDSEKFYLISKGLEKEEEGGERCFKCYKLRLEETAKLAKKGNYDYFTTTLTISPYKSAQKLNCIGKDLTCKYKVKYLYSDFKKKNGYKRSIELSKIYNLYRQNYCGCVFSKNELP
ncbi:epoxyqueuosine reductase QueH [Clostridium sp.]|uniref:epoxyqueuosine reductase QueH n=1 Tax=Clostridium sp. TaxID=1506 RepID=UPI0035A100E7